MSSTSSTESGSELMDAVTPLPAITPSRKRPRSSHDFFELLICPICYDYFAPPVVNCRKGHSYCLSCIDKMERSTGDARCPQCRAPLDKTSRNHIIEDQLEKVSVGCMWHERGCTQRVSLSSRESHERECQYKPGSVNCLYSHEVHEFVCSWSGNPLQLPRHLAIEHCIGPIERNRTVKFLWNPPQELVGRHRYRILSIAYPSGGCSKTNFLLEHIYIPQHKVLLFAVRTFDSEIKLLYNIHLLNRNEESNKLTFSDITSEIDPERHGLLADYPKIDKRRALSIGYETIKDFCFLNPEDSTEYFSFHVEFCFSENNEVAF